MIKNTLFKTYGGKYYLTEFTYDHFPQLFTRFFDLFGGGGTITLSRSKTCQEFLNDIDPKIHKVYWYVKYDPEIFENALRSFKYGYESWVMFKSWDRTIPVHYDTNLYMAVREYALRRMSRNGLKVSYSTSTRLRRGMPEGESAWLSSLDRIKLYSKRLNSVELSCANAISLMGGQPFTWDDFLYIDPPYMGRTRYLRSAYDFEMTDKQHAELVSMCLQLKAKIMIAGRHNTLYDAAFKDWRCVERGYTSAAAHPEYKETGNHKEVLWMNYGEFS